MRKVIVCILVLLIVLAGCGSAEEVAETTVAPVVVAEATQDPSYVQYPEIPVGEAGGDVPYVWLKTLSYGCKYLNSGITVEVTTGTTSSYINTQKSLTALLAAIETDAVVAIINFNDVLYAVEESDDGYILIDVDGEIFEYQAFCDDAIS